MMRAVALSLLFLLSGAVHAAEFDKNAVVTLRVIYQDSKMGTGSGFFFRKDGSIMTCYHVIEGARRIDVIDRNGKIYRDISVLGFSPLHDIAKIRIKNAEESFPTLSIISDSPDKFPDELKLCEAIMLTNLAKFKPLPVTIITDLNKAIYLEELFKERDTFSPAGQQVRLYGIHANVQGGMSGSPVLYYGKVLGILSGSKTEGTDFAWIIPMEHFKTIEGQKEQSVSDIVSWPKLALMNTEWNLLNQFQRSNIKDPDAEDKDQVEVVYPPVFTGESARVLIRPRNAEMSHVTVDGVQAVRQPSGDFMLTLFLNPDHTKTMIITAVLSQENIIVNDTIQMTRLDLEKIPDNADEIRAEVVKAQSLNQDFETAFNTLVQISDYNIVQKARRYMGESLLRKGRLADAARFADMITDKNEHYEYVRNLVKKYIEMEKPDAAVQFVEKSLPLDRRGPIYEMIVNYLLKSDKIDTSVEICRKIQDRNEQLDLFIKIARTQLERNQSDSAAKIMFYSHPHGNVHHGRKIEMAIRIAHAQYITGNPDGARDTLNQAFRATGFMEAGENDEIAEKLDGFLAISIAQHRLNFKKESINTLRAAYDIVHSVKSQLRKDVLFKDKLLGDMAATLSITGDYHGAAESAGKIVRPSKRTLGYIYAALNLLRNNDFTNTAKIVNSIEQNRNQLKMARNDPYWEHSRREDYMPKEYPAWYRSWYPVGTYTFEMEKLRFDIKPRDTDSSLGLIAKEQAVSGDIQGCFETMKYIQDIEDKDTVLWVSSIQLMKNGNGHESYDFARRIKNHYRRALAFIEIAKDQTLEISIISKTPSAIPIAENIAEQDVKDLYETLSIYFEIIKYLINANAKDEALAYYQKCLEHMNESIQKMQGKASRDTGSVAVMLVHFMRLFRVNKMDQRFNEAAELFKTIASFYKNSRSKGLFKIFAIELAQVGRYQEAIAYAKMDFDENEAMEEIVSAQCNKKEFDAARETIKLMNESWEKERALRVLATSEIGLSPDKAMNTVSKMHSGYRKDNSYWNVALSQSDFLNKMATMDKIKDQEEFEDQRIEMIVSWARYRDLQPLLLWLRSGESVTPHRRFNAYMGITSRYR